MTFKDKRRFFEKEIADQATAGPPGGAAGGGHGPRVERKFSFLQEHEVALLKKEEAKKVLQISPAEILQGAVDATDYSVLISNLATSTVPSPASVSGRSATERLFGRNSLPRRPTSSPTAAVAEAGIVCAEAAFHPSMTTSVLNRRSGGSDTTDDNATIGEGSKDAGE